MEDARQSRASTPLRVYASEAEALRRFRTVPRQPEALPYVLAHIAKASVARVETGWTWRFDPKIFGHDRLPLTGLGAPRCPVTLIRAEHGIISPRLEAAMIRAGGVQLRVVPLPEAHHHMMIDMPVEMLAAIRTCLNHHGVFPQELQ